MDKHARRCRLEAVRDYWKGCTQCLLNCYRNKIVWWRGNVDSELLLIGEAPGKKEDETGLPFVGKAGKLLDAIFLEATGEKLEDFALVANVVACRPPNNRTPKIEEMKACSRRLFSIAKIIKPKVVILLGSTAAKRIAGVQPITRWRGNFVEAALIGEKRRTISFNAMPTFHPSYLLRQGVDSKEYSNCITDIRNAWEMVYG